MATRVMDTPHRTCTTLNYMRLWLSSSYSWQAETDKQTDGRTQCNVLSYLYRYHTVTQNQRWTDVQHRTWYDTLGVATCAKSSDEHKPLRRQRLSHRRCDGTRWNHESRQPSHVILSTSELCHVTTNQQLRSCWGWEWAFVQNPFHGACSRRWL